jgi:hypothetical protein
MVRYESSARRPQAVAALGAVAVLAFGLFVLTCSDKTTDHRQQTPPKITDISELQQHYGELLVDMIAELDSSTAKDSVTKLVLMNKEIVESAIANSQGVAVKYRDGQRGGIMIDPEDMAGSAPDAAARFHKAQIALDTVYVPRSHHSIFLCPIFSERRAYAEQIIQSANESLPKTGFGPFDILADDSCGIDKFKDVDDCGIVHIYSHSFAWPRKDSIEEVYLMTGDTLTEDLSAKYSTDMAAGKVASIYVPGKGNVLFIDHQFFTSHNHFGGNLTVVYLGFGYSFASKWYQQTRYISNAGVCIGYDWRVFADKNADWASEFYRVMCDTSESRQSTIGGWYDEIVTSYTDTLETTPPLPRTTEIRFHGMSEISMWRSLRILSVSPTNGPPGTKVSIRGIGFGNSRNLGQLTICGISPTIQSWSDSLIVAIVPQNASIGDIQVTVGTISSNTMPFWVVSLDGVYPSRAVYGDTITLSGRGFGAERGDGTVMVGDKAATVLGWGDTEISAIVPDGATSGGVFVSKNGLATNAVSISVFGITGVVPSRVSRGSVIDVHTAGFVCRSYHWGVYFDTIQATQTYGWLNDIVRVEVPASVPSTCTLFVTCDQLRSKGYPLFVTGVTGINSNWGGPGSEVRIYGSGFGSEPAPVIFAPESESEVSLWTDDSIVAVVPESAVSGAIKIVYDDATFQTPIFKVMRIDRLEPTFGLPGHTVVIRGSNFLDYRITDSVTFGDYSAKLVYWSDTMTTVTVPAIVHSEDVTLHVKGARSNSVSFLLLGADRIQPNWGPVGTEISIFGRGFVGALVSTFLSGQSAAVSHSVVSDTLITLIVPNWAKSGPLQVKYGQMLVAASFFEVFKIDSMAPQSGVAGDVVRIHGSGFESLLAGDSVWFGSKPAAVTYWRNTLVCALVPEDATTCEVKVVKNSVQAVGGTFTVFRKPVVQSVTPSRGTYGTAASIRGLHFGETRGSGAVKFGSVAAQIGSWSDTLIAATYPSGSKTDSVRVTAGGFTSDPVPYRVHGIVSVIPTKVVADAPVTITGTGFGAPSASSYVRVGDVTLPCASWSDSLITATIPEMAVSGSLTVTVDGLASNAVVITMLRGPVLIGISPSFGTYGMHTTLSGQYLGASQGSSKVYFGAKAAATVSWSDETIVAKFPDGSTSDTVAVVVNSFRSNTLPYRVFGITGLSRYWADVGDTVAVFGHGFGESQSTARLEFGNVEMSPLSWSDDSIRFVVPADAATGDVAVVVEGITSNAKQLDIGVPANLMELLHQTRIMEVSYSGYLRVVSCSGAYPPSNPHCDTSIRVSFVRASNESIVREGYGLLSWDTTHVSVYHAGGWGTYSWSHYIEGFADLTTDCLSLIQASMAESHFFDAIMSGDWSDAIARSEGFTILEISVQDTVVRYQSRSTAGYGGFSNGYWNTVEHESTNGAYVDSLSALNPPTVTVTFRRK